MMQTAGVHKCLEAQVLENVKVGSDGFVLRVTVPPDHELSRARILPGQFFMLRDPRPGFPFLSRPFSVLDDKADREGRLCQLSFLFKIVGQGTAMLAALRPNDSLSLVGPLGNCWPQSPGRAVVGVAGGIGIPPLYLEIKRLQQLGADLRHYTLIYGARTAGQLYLHRELEEMGVRTLVCTEDGSLGQRGRVDAALRGVLAGVSASAVEIHACGPERMLEVVGKLAVAQRVRCFSSLETFMGCGFGVCNACAVKVIEPTRAEGFKFERCCREGSIFDHARLLWE